MSQETMHPDPVQQISPVEGGLTPEQQQQAIELRQNILEKDIQLAHTQANAYGNSHTGMLSGNTVSGPSVISAWSGDIATGFRSQQLKSAVRAAKKHYKKNEAAYQMQALQEATEAGVEVNGWPYEAPKDIPKKRLGNLALAAADGATAAFFASSLVTPVSARDLIPGYLAYRYGKGTAVRASAAIKGKGDTEMALATHVSVPMAFHGSKEKLHARRRESK